MKAKIDIDNTDESISLSNGLDYGEHNMVILIHWKKKISTMKTLNILFEYYVFFYFFWGT